MENHYFETVIAEMQEFLDEQNFKFVETGVYQNEKKAVKVAFDEKKQMYRLYMAEVEEEKIGEFVEVTSWLFDETQNEKDAASVGMDFTDTVRSKMGVKIKRKTDAQIDLPTFSKDGAYNVTAFSKKVLDVFPQLKEPYREHIAKYGNFLYIDFFGKYLVPELVAVYSENTKKSVKKVTEMFENGYVNGDKEAVNIIVAVLSAAAGKDEKVKANIIAALGENKHFIGAINSFIPTVQNNKKISKALLK